jgi:hypothetical protein
MKRYIKIIALMIASTFAFSQCKNDAQSYTNTQGFRVEFIDSCIYNIIENANTKGKSSKFIAKEIRNSFDKYFKDSTIVVANVVYRFRQDNENHEINWANQPVPLPEVFDDAYGIICSQMPVKTPRIKCLCRKIESNGISTEQEVYYGKLKHIYELNKIQYGYYLHYRIKQASTEMNIRFMIPILKDIKWIDNCNDFKSLGYIKGIDIYKI